MYSLVSLIFANLPENQRNLVGRQKDGIPKGLEECPSCRTWNGECLDPDPLLWGEGLLTVQCRCSGNICRKCRQESLGIESAHKSGIS